jgi:hypothetical protein
VTTKAVTTKAVTTRAVTSRTVTSRTATTRTSWGTQRRQPRPGVESSDWNRLTS